MFIFHNWYIFPVAFINKSGIFVFMKEIGEHDEVDEKVARAIVTTLNWVHYKWGNVSNRKKSDTTNS